VDVVIVMGVSGCGKSSLGRLLAARLGAAFLEGDDFHPAGNVAKMASGIPLDDADRWPWLARLADAVRQRRRDGVVVAACSSLKRSYRDRLRSLIAEPLCFVCLNPGRGVLERRLRARPGHFMPPSLLDSQLRTLELPQPDEAAILVTGDEPPATLLQSVAGRLRECDASG
jgi:gluconokinase